MSPSSGDCGAGSGAFEGGWAARGVRYCSAGTQAHLDPDLYDFYCAHGLHRRTSRSMVWKLGCCLRNSDAASGEWEGSDVWLLEQRIPEPGGLHYLEYAEMI